MAINSDDFFLKYREGEGLTPESIDFKQAWLLFECYMKVVSYYSSYTNRAYKYMQCLNDHIKDEK